MKKAIIIAVTAGISGAPLAAADDGDSTAVTGLKEIVVEAPRVIRKADMDVVARSKTR